MVKPGHWLGLVLWVLFLQCTHTHTTVLRPFFRVNRCEEIFWTLWCTDIRDRHSNNPAGRHTIRTNQRPTSFISPFLRHMSFLSQPSQFILAWYRHQICWLAYHWLGLPSGLVTQWIGFSTLSVGHCWLGDTKGFWLVRNLCHLPPKVHFQQKWRRKPRATG